MQDRFPWLVQPSEEEFERLWQEATFVFDTNVLLDLYRRSRSFKEDFFEVLEGLEGRVWLPHQVAEEFMRNRSGPIASQLGTLDSAEEKVKAWYKDLRDLNQLQDDLENIGSREGPVEREVEDLLSESEALQQAVEEFRDQVLESIDSLREDLLPTSPRAPQSEDDTLANLEEIFEDRISDPYDEEELQEIYQEGSRRYSDNIPPGFGDDEKERESRKYADLVIWKQIINRASSQDGDLVFVTRDTAKDDWWEEKSNRTVGPLTHLRKEFYQETGNLFWMYQVGERFLNLAKDELGVDVSDTSIEEARQHESAPPASEEDLLEDALRDLRAVSELPTEELQGLAQHAGIAGEILRRSQTLSQLSQSELQRVLNRIGGSSITELIRAAKLARQASHHLPDIGKQVHFTGDPERHPEPPEEISEGEQGESESTDS